MQPCLKPSVTGTFSDIGAPFALPTQDKRPTAKDVGNHIRICPNVTLSPGRDFMFAAIRAKRLTIGVPPHKSSVETSDNPTSYYEGSYLMQLDPFSSQNT